MSHAHRKFAWIALLGTALSSGALAQGWEGGKAPAKPAAVEQLSESDQARYDAVALAIVSAINAHDLAALQALFTEEGWADAIDWWHDGFAAQTKRFGRIAQAWSPRRGIVRAGDVGVGGDARNGATFLAHFEQPCGAALSFELNEENKIVYSSCWVHESLGQAKPAEIPAIFAPKPSPD